MSACDPDSRAVMKEVFVAAPGGGFIRGLLPDGFEELARDCLAVGEDIEDSKRKRKNSLCMRPDVYKREGRKALLTSEAE